MGYKWLPVTEDFDKTLVIKKWRFDVSIPISGNYDGALSELPNIDIKTCWNNSQPENGYAFSNRFNLGTKYFSSRYYGWTDHYWTATTEANTTLVSGTTYEFECPVDLYWAGVRESTFDSNIPNYMWFYAQSSSFETDVTAITASYNSTTCAVTITTEEETEWTASTSNNWITISPNQGTGSSVFVVTINKNTNYASRTGLITISNSDGEVIEIDVTQEKHPLFVPKDNIYRADLEVDELYRSGNEIVKMYRSGDLIYQKLSSVIDDSTIPLTFEIITSGTILWKKYTNNAPDRTIQYRINNGNWESIAANDTAGTAINVSVGDIVQFKGNNASYCTTTYYGQACQFGGTATFYAYGNIMSLIYGDNFIGQNTLEENYTFVGLFRFMNGLTSHIVHKLVMPATTLTNNCYSNMFFGTNITNAPELPATNLTVACYLNMFSDTPLISAPQLPATTLTQSCYDSMFSYCTNLTTAPELPATTLVNSCYNFMFAHCSSLNYVKCLATDISASNCTRQWLDSVAANGTFIKDSSMSSWTSGVNGIPSGWTVQNA